MNQRARRRLLVGLVAAATVIVSATAAAADTPPTVAWPGPTTVRTADGDGLGSNLSGLAFSTATGTTRLWAVRDDPSELLLLESRNGQWVPIDGWQGGRRLRYPTGSGEPDAEGVTALAGQPDTVYVAAERDNGQLTVSRNSVLRYDVTAGSGALRATQVWDLNPLLPRADANTGIEGIAWVPDAVFEGIGFTDTTGRAYRAADLGPHAGGLFMIGFEATGELFVVALEDSGRATLIGSLASGQPAVMDLSWDAARNELWALCDNRCNSRAAVLRPDASAHGFAVAQIVQPPAALASRNNEGLALAPTTNCTNGSTAVVFSDDSASDGHALREAALTCRSSAVTATSSAPGATTATPTSPPSAGDGGGSPLVWVLAGAGAAAAGVAAVALGRRGKGHRDR